MINFALVCQVCGSHRIYASLVSGKASRRSNHHRCNTLLTLLLSQMPFYGKKRYDLSRPKEYSLRLANTIILLRRHIVELIMNCKFDFKGRRWKRVSKQAKAFVEDLLVADPEDRATADSAYRSTWLNRRQMATVRNPHEEENEKAQQSLLKYAGYSKLKKVVSIPFLRSNL